MNSEFEFINLLQREAGTPAVKSEIKIGIGDDCAVLRHNNKTDLLITTDLLVEEVDFRLRWTTPELLGHKALAVSLSDVAAMGGKPLWALVSIGVPANLWQTNFVEEFYQGWFGLAKQFNVELAGGDISRSPDKLVIDSIVAGRVKKNRALLRSGARPGDLIFVTGSLGGAAGGLKLLENGLTLTVANSDVERELIRRQLCPMPQTKIAEILRKNNLATAMIDLSDGLSSDLFHLCKASKVGAKIEADKIPLDKNALRFPDLKTEALSLALNGGEDFELLFTVNKKNEKKLKKHLSNISCVGKIMKSSFGINLLCDSQTNSLQPQGFRHF